MKTKFLKIVMIALGAALLSPHLVQASAQESATHLKSASRKFSVKLKTNKRKVAKKSSAQKVSAKKSTSKSTSKSVSHASLQKPTGQLSNDLTFDGSVVKGQYQIADGSTSVVENEKTLNTLIDPRKDFKDRMLSERISQ